MPGIQMAKAKTSEVDNAIKLAHLTDAVCNCRSFEYPKFPVEDDGDTPYAFDVEEPASLRMFYDRVSKLSGGLMRVAFGYGVLVDNLCNQTKDVLEIKQGLMQFDEVEQKAISDFYVAHKTYLEEGKKLDELPDTSNDVKPAMRDFSEAGLVRLEKAINFSMLMLKSAGLE